MSLSIDKSSTLTPDIYGINDYVNEIKKRFTPDVHEDTLMLGIFGYTGQIFSDELQNSIVMASEFSNESIATKAKFEKNVIAHALGLGIVDINAKPAQLDIIMAFLEEDIIQWAKARDGDGNEKPWEFTFDSNTDIYLGQYCFHADYDIMIRKVRLENSGEKDKFTYTAKYLINEDNPVSDVTNPYLASPVRLCLNGQNVLFAKCTVRQVKKNTIYKKVLSDNSISAKTFTFDFSGQLAAFTIDVYEGKARTHMIPVYEGLSTEVRKYPYFYYTYLDSNTIRVKFDRKSYQPRINCDVAINIYTTEGEGGNFTFNPDIFPGYSFESNRTDININPATGKGSAYSNISCEIRPVTGEALYGTDKKSIEDLKKLIPKEAIARGSITNMTDLQNFFNMINTDTSITYFYKKRDNALTRLYYSFMLMKDQYNNVIPTNTINLRVFRSQLQTEAGSQKLIFKRGQLVRYIENYDDPELSYGYLYDPSQDAPDPPKEDAKKYIAIETTEVKSLPSETDGEIVGEIKQYSIVYVYETSEDGLWLRIDEDKWCLAERLKEYTGEDLTYKCLGCKYYDAATETCTSSVCTNHKSDYDSTFYYVIPYSFIINTSPLYCMYFLSTIDTKKYLDFSYINDQCLYQYVATYIKWHRGYIEDPNTYYMTIEVMQNVIDDVVMVDFKDKVDDEGNIVLDDEGKPIQIIDEESTHDKIRCIAVFYDKEDKPYRWADGKIKSFDQTSNLFTFQFAFTTEDYIDIDNRIRIDSGMNDILTENDQYGHFTANTKCIIHIITRQKDSLGLNDLDKLIPNIDQAKSIKQSDCTMSNPLNFSLSNSYTVIDGIDFFYDYSEIIDSVVIADDKDPNKAMFFRISQVPVVKSDYFDNEDKVLDFCNELVKRKNYIDQAIRVLEDAFGMDFKFFNTYGPSRLFTLDNELERVNRTSLSLTFRLKLRPNHDSNVVNDIIQDIKEYIEDINSIRSLHMPNLITEITTNYRDALVFFEFVDMNGYGPSIQHLYSMEMPDKVIPPEFLNVYTLADGTPDINIIMV